MAKTNGMLAAVMAAAGVVAGDGADPDKIEVNAAFVAQHLPDTASALRAEGAAAERERIAGIEKALIPGHEDIISAMKADATKTPGDAAMAVIAAENSAVAGRKDALNADEDKLKGLASTATGGKPEGADEDTPQAKMAKARALSAAATKYIAEQKALGVSVSIEAAVEHVSRKGA